MATPRCQPFPCRQIVERGYLSLDGQKQHAITLRIDLDTGHAECELPAELRPNEDTIPRKPPAHEARCH